MAQNPMDFFSNHAKKKEEKGPPPSLAANKNEEIPSAEGESLPENWREKVKEAIDFLREIRSYGAEVPAKYRMSEREFEDWGKNRSFFSQEEWEILERVREQTHHFLQEMRALAKGRSPLLKPARKKKSPQDPKSLEVLRRWISVD